MRDISFSSLMRATTLSPSVVVDEPNASLDSGQLSVVPLYDTDEITLADDSQAELEAVTEEQAMHVSVLIDLLRRNELNGFAQRIFETLAYRLSDNRKEYQGASIVAAEVVGDRNDELILALADYTVPLQGSATKTYANNIRCQTFKNLRSDATVQNYSSGDTPVSVPFGTTAAPVA